MKFGVAFFLTDHTLGPVELARAAEERGYHSVFVPEHTHIPTSRRTPPPTGEPELPEAYKHTLDPLVALAAMASVTERIRLGTGISLVAQREPIVTAKAIATLDHISGGRVDLGIGFNWNEDEVAHHGVTMSERRAVAREHVLAMQALWRDDVAEFHGDHVDFSPSWSYPKPLQRPGPPVLLGGAAGPTLFAHLAEYGDGWIPFGGKGLATALDDLHAAFERAGRDPATCRVVPFGVIPDSQAKLDHYASLGIEEIVLRIPADDPAATLAALDDYTRLPAG